VLYGTISGDDRVLVPLLPDDPVAAAILGGRLAAAHGEVGRFVLLEPVTAEASADAAADRRRGPRPPLRRRGRRPREPLTRHVRPPDGASGGPATHRSASSG
jgi:hypothetical protein